MERQHVVRLLERTAFDRDLPQAILRRARLATRALDTQFFGLAEQPQLAERILELAHASQCATVVVSGDSLARTRTTHGSTLATELVSRAGDLAVWVVA